MSRREFAVAAVAAVASVPRALAGPAPVAVAQFTERDLDVLDAVKAVVYGPGADGLDIRPGLLATLALLDDDKQATLASLPTLFDRLSRVLVPTGGAFASLSPEARVAALEDWIHSPLAFRRQVGQALRQLVLAHCYADERTWVDVGYAGPWIGRVEVPVHPLRFGEPS